MRLVFFRINTLPPQTIVEHQSLKESLPSEDIENNHHSSEDGIKGKLEVRYNGSSSHPSDESNNVTEPSVILLTQLVEEGNPECHICLESFHVGEKYSTSNISGCNHGYHQECVSQWLTKKTTCPSCRNTFVSAKRCGSKTYRDTSESYPINTNNNSVGTSVALASTTHPTTRREI